MNAVKTLRDRVLTTARAFVLSRGYARMTMDALAAELRVSKKTLYQHFASKEALGFAVLDQAFEEISTALREIAEDRSIDFETGLEQWVHVLTVRYAEAGRALESLKYESPVLWDRLLELRRASVHDHLGRMIARGVREKAVRNDVAPDLLVLMVLTLVDQLLRPEVVGALELRMDTAYAQILAVMIDGMRPRPASGKVAKGSGKARATGRSRAR